MKILDFFRNLFGGKKVLSGDFSSFNLECPVKDCGWYFQTLEMFDEHIKNGKHGV